MECLISVRRRRRFNVGGVLDLSDPPAKSSALVWLLIATDNVTACVSSISVCVTVANRVSVTSTESCRFALKSSILLLEVAAVLTTMYTEFCKASNTWQLNAQQSLSKHSSTQSTQYTNHTRQVTLRRLNSVSSGLVRFISLKMQDLLTQESRPGQISAGRRGRISDLDSSDWSNGLRYHNFNTSPDTEFNRVTQVSSARAALSFINEGCE